MWYDRYTIGTVIMLNVLLDWVDGPVARHYGQSSIIGCGWDWLADILAQVCIRRCIMCASSQHPNRSSHAHTLFITGCHHCLLYPWVAACGGGKDARWLFGVQSVPLL